MFEYFKIKRDYFKATEKIILPEMEYIEPKAAESRRFLFTKKRHTVKILRAAACAAMMLALVGAVALHNSGWLPIKVTTAQSGISEKGTATKNSLVNDSFVLVAYAAPKDAVSGANDPAAAQGTVDLATRTVLGSNEKVTLPVGRLIKIPGISDPEEVAYTDSQGLKRYMLYMFKYSAGFRFEGSNIETITVSADGHKIICKNETQIQKYRSTYGADADKLTAAEKALFMSYIKSGDSMTITPDYTAYWTLSPTEWDIISRSGNFTDFQSLPQDTISIQVKFTDGTVKTSTVTMSLNNDGSVSAVLN